MRAIRVHFDDGQTIETNINGTPDEIRRHYIGVPFEFDETQPCHTATRVEFLDEVLSSTSPGPWHAHPPHEHHEDSPYWEIEDACGHTATVYGNDKEARNNALVIAAAPELLELLTTVLLRIDMEPRDTVFPCSAMRDDIRAAITKATKGTP